MQHVGYRHGLLGLLIVTLLGAFGFATTAAAVTVLSTFDADEEGWTSVPASVNFAAAGGNPGGYLHHVDASATSTYIIAPSQFLGDWSSGNSLGSVGFDHKIFSLGSVVNGFLPYEIRIAGSGDQATWFGATPAGTTDWLSLTAPLNEAAWSVTGNWSDLLLNVTDLRIRIELVDNGAGSGDSAGVDNVRLELGEVAGGVIPEPATGVLLVVGGLASLISCKRRLSTPD